MLPAQNVSEGGHQVYASFDKMDKDQAICFAKLPSIIVQEIPIQACPSFRHYHHHHCPIVHFRPALSPSKSLGGLPLAGILDALGDRSSAVLNPGADVGDSVPQRPAEAARRASHRLSEAARGRADDSADCVCKAADGVAEGRGDHLAGARDARVLVLVVHGGC